MPDPNGLANEQLISTMDSVHVAYGANRLRLLSLIAEADKRELWRDSGYRDTASWVAGRYGVTRFQAGRWVEAAHRLPSLPRIATALRDGTLSLDKVVELTRLATPDDERSLVKWARGVSPSWIRHKADAAKKPEMKEATDAHDQRRLQWWFYDGGYRFGLSAELPAEQGRRLALALDRIAAEIPRDEDAWDPADARRADALMLLASSRLAVDPDVERSSVHVHATLDALLSDTSHCSLEGGALVHPETARRMACDGRIQVVLHDGETTVGIGYSSRNVPARLQRELRRIYEGCCFPGCASRHMLHAHHVIPWPLGPTDLDNLVLVCPFHHELVHEGGWRVILISQGIVEWRRRDGTVFTPGPSPPARASDLVGA